jgi:HK97 family phage major capsid protein
VKLAGLADSTGQPLSRPPMLANLPMLSTTQIPTNLTVGTSNDCSEIYVGDFSKMAMMLREGLSVQLLSEAFAGNGQLAFMCHCRADFTVFYPAAFAVVTGVRA